MRTASLRRSTLLAPFVASGELRAGTLPAGSPEAGPALLAWAGEVWSSISAVWLGLSAPVRHRSRRAGTGFGPLPTCDAGGSLDPSGRCVPGAVHSPVLLPTCDEGGTLDPSGHCVAKTARSRVFRPTCDAGHDH
jgi:hypothetical protein